MQFTGNRRTAEQMIEGVRELDLEPIKFKLMDAAEGEGWTREFAERTEVQYRRFLALLAKYPHEPIAPGKDVDRFWHAHILDTQKYTEDCDRVFGRYLHHFPYFGMRGADDAAALAAAGARTRELDAAEFAPATPGGWNGATPTGGAFCSVAGQSFCSVAGAGHIDTVTRPRPAPIA